MYILKGTREKENVMKKRWKVFAICLLVVLLMNGCEKKPIDMNITGDAKDYEEAGSSYTRNIGVVFIDTGFYYQNMDGQLMYFDDETNQVVYVCSKPNCKHEVKDNECDANIHGNNFPMVYRNGRIYYTSAIDKSGFQQIVMFSVKPDGSDRKKESELSEVAFNSDGYCVELYKQYAIVFLDIGDTREKIELVDSDTGERSVLYDKDDKLTEACGPFIYYDEVYYGEIERDKDGNKMNEIFYRYNLKTKKTRQVYEGNIEARTFAKDYLIFSDGKAINRIPLTGGKVEKLFDYEGSCELGYDGKYLYVEHEHDYRSDVGNMQAKCDDHWVKVMKLDGTEVDTIKWNNRGLCLFGDQRVLLFMKISESGMTDSTVLMKKSDIGGKHNFIDLANGEPCEE